MSKSSAPTHSVRGGGRKMRDPDEWGEPAPVRERSTRDVRKRVTPSVRPSVLAMTDSSSRNFRKSQHRSIGAGELHYVRIPYTEGEGDKARPAIVVGVTGEEVHVLPITSSAKGLTHAAYILQHPEVAGLTRRSGVRGTIVTISLDEVQRGSYVGDLSEADRGGCAIWLDLF